MSDRARLLAELMTAGREIGAATVFFHQAVAESGGLCAADHKYLDELVRLGPVTAGELAEATGLTTGAATGMIDRLEAAGLARRERDAADRRKVIVVPLLSEAQCRLGPLFEGLAAQLEALHARFQDDELELITGYLRQCSTVLRQQTRALRTAAEAQARHA
jgi:DNA-binding MarR family transcriptional regulator